MSETTEQPEGTPAPRITPMTEGQLLLYINHLTRKWLEIVSDPEGHGFTDLENDNV